MRLIDADAFDATMYEAWKNNEVTNEEWIHFREMIKDEPTIEPQRKRGKWVKKDIVLTSNPPQYLWHCSSCMAVVHGMTDAILPCFCPNCGADMRWTG